VERADIVLDQLSGMTKAPAITINPPNQKESDTLQSTGTVHLARIPSSKPATQVQAET